ncbi:MAG: TetR/AcrR family transcriptional regulator [Clostridiales bacterium]|nr:TetR/AcrR family transcriptional regulator [Clostridiales bacterium]
MTIMDAKRNFVIDSAANLFLERQIATVTVKEIAKASGVGEATIYRYFSTKHELVVACALKLQSETEMMFSKYNSGNLKGFKGIEKFYRTFLEAFKKRPQLYHFLSEFDAYCISNNIDNLDEYADNMDRFKSAFITAYNEGVNEGSVRRIENIELFYYSTTHAILSLCKKLASCDGVLRQDKAIDKGAEIETLINTVLFSLKAAV